MAGVVYESGATTFNYIMGETDNSYKFTSKSLGQTKYFNVDILTSKGDICYSSASTQSTYNDLLLISQTQREAYNTYVKA